jgi:hypothetical protein
MRVLRIAIRNFQGVRYNEVQFAPVGVTILEGPNEIGKTSLVRALDLLFDELHSSGKERVRDVQALGASSGPEVEADIEAGPYRFTYWKRWLRGSGARLTVHEPRAEELQDRQAHEKVIAILEETTDLALWRALRIQQGAGGIILDQPELVRSQSLAMALDAAAGGVRPDAGRATSLVERAEQELQQYVTPERRQPKGDYDRAIQDEAAARQSLADLEARLSALDADIRRHEDFTRRKAELIVTMAGTKRRIDELEASEAAVRAARECVEKAKSAEERSVFAAANAASLHTQRDQLLGQAERLGTHILELEGELGKQTSVLSDLEHDQSQALDDRNISEEQESAATQCLTLTNADLRYLQAQQDAERLHRDLVDIRAAEGDETAGRRTLAEALVDKAKLAIIKKAADDLLEKGAAATAQSANLLAKALSSVDLFLDGERRQLKPGDELEATVMRRVELLIPGVINVTMTTAVGTETAAYAVDTARAALAEACSSAGVTTLDEAERALTAVDDARRVVTQARKTIQRLLLDAKEETPEGIVSRLQTLDAYLAAYPSERSGDTPIPTEFGDVRKLLTEAEAASTSARRALVTARQRYEDVAEQRQARELTLVSVATELKEARTRREAVGADLADARKVVLDEELALATQHAKEVLDGLRADRIAKESALSSLNPEGVEERLASVRAAHASSDEELRGVSEKCGALELVFAREDAFGLYEQVEAARQHLLVLERRVAQFRARSQAAIILVDALHAHRDEARQRYRLPLAERMDRLGRIVFGADFSVELGAALEIRSRLLGGQAMPYRYLSPGPKEQLGIIARLAAASLVASDGGGVPVILDDALGCSDVQRLEGVAAVLSVATSDLQVIVLTANAERYRAVRGARIVSVSSAGPAADSVGAGA